MSESLIILLMKLIPINLLYVLFKDIFHFFHKPIKTIKYLDHIRQNKNVISNHVIKIKLRKEDIFSYNKQTNVYKIEFCFMGFDSNGKEFNDKYPIEIIDPKALNFVKDEDIQDIDIKIPFFISIKYFGCKELELLVGLTSVNKKFSFVRVEDLTKDIINPFFDLTRKQLKIIEDVDKLMSDKSFRKRIQDKISFERETDEEFDLKNLNEDQFVGDENGNFLNKNGETREEYDKRTTSEE